MVYYIDMLETDREREERLGYSMKIRSPLGFTRYLSRGTLERIHQERQMIDRIFDRIHMKARIGSLVERVNGK